MDYFKGQTKNIFGDVQDFFSTRLNGLGTDFQEKKKNDIFSSCNHIICKILINSGTTGLLSFGNMTYNCNPIRTKSWFYI